MAILTFAQAFGGGGAAAPAAAQPEAAQPTQPVQPSQPSSQIVPLNQAFQPQPTQQPATGQRFMGPPTQAPGTATNGQGGPDALTQANQANSWLQSGGKLANIFNPGITKDIAGTGLNLQDVTGPLNLASGIKNDDWLKAASGGVSTLSTGLRLADMPAASKAVGGLTGPLALAGGIQRGNALQATSGGLQTASTLANLAGYSGLSAGIGSLAGPLSLAAGIKSGDPLQIASGAISTYGTLSTLSGLAANAGLLPSALPSVGTLAGNVLAAVAPELAASLGIGTTGAALSSLGVSGATAASLAGAAPAAAAEALMGGTVAGVGAGTGAAAAGGGASAGIAAASGTAAALGATFTAVLAPFAIAALMQGLEGKAPLGIGEGKPEGWSKVVTARRTAASQMYDSASQYATSARTGVENALKQPGSASPDVLRTEGKKLLDAWQSYFNWESVGGTRIGPSSHQTEGDQSQNSWNRALADWRAINEALLEAGQPGLDIPAGAVSVSGILNSTLPDASGDWKAIVAPENQSLLNWAFMNYTKGVPANEELKKSTLAKLGGPKAGARDQVEAAAAKRAQENMRVYNARMEAQALRDQQEWARQTALLSPGGGDGGAGGDGGGGDGGGGDGGGGDGGAY